MASDEKYGRLLNPSAPLWQFDSYDLGQWSEHYIEVEIAYNTLRKYRKDLPEWPITVFGPVHEVRRLTQWDVLRTELEEAVKKELQEPKDQTFPVMTGVLKALKDAHLFNNHADVSTPYFRNFLSSLESDDGIAKTVCFAWATAKMYGAASPGTRKFLQQIQDMILTHCDPPNPRRRPLLAVSTRHPKLNVRTVLSALNFGHLHRLKRVGNVRACKNWVGEKREELREYRRQLFRGYKASGKHSWIPKYAVLIEYDLDGAFNVGQDHDVCDDPDDGEQTPQRTPSPPPGDPFWGDIFHAEAPSESDDNADAQLHPSAPPGKNHARNKKKAEKKRLQAEQKRLRKFAEDVVNNVFHHSGAATPVGAAEEEATRATTPAVAPAARTEEEKETARRAKIKAKRQRQKERKAAAAKQGGEPGQEDGITTPAPTPAPSSPPYSPPPAKTPSPASSPAAAAMVQDRSDTPSSVAAPVFSAPVSVAPATRAISLSALPPSPPASPLPRAHGAVSPLQNSRFVSLSGVPVPLFWAFDVEALEEDTFLASSSSAAAAPGPHD